MKEVTTEKLNLFVNYKIAELTEAKDVYRIMTIATILLRYCEEYIILKELESIKD